MRIKLIIAFFTLLLPCSTNGQTEVLDPLADKLGTFQKNYVYPSVARALTRGAKMQALDQLIEGLHLIRILRLDSSFVSMHKDMLEKVSAQLLQTSFEEVATWNDAREVERRLFMDSEQEKIQGMLFLQKEPHAWLIVEWVGAFDPSNLSVFMDPDFTALNENLGFLWEP
jgi:hypothetical protein